MHKHIFPLMGNNEKANFHSKWETEYCYNFFRLADFYTAIIISQMIRSTYLLCTNREARAT